MSRKHFLIGGFALVHFVATVLLFMTSFSLSMARFGLRPPTIREKVIGRLSELLLFPFFPISRWLHFPVGGADWIFVFGNSLLWGTCAYYLMDFFRRRSVARKSLK
ncbi:MAG: hypothetical protein H7145_01410 [Akkermansiaceae bacterium]|nr:hypothetical protein [Armatimonadota bacterium]